MKLRSYLISFGCLLCIVILTGCTLQTAPPDPASNSLSLDTDAGEDAGRNENLTPLKVAVAPYLTYAAFYIALEEGYFEAQGIDVEIVNMTRSSDAIPALLQGQLDVLGTNVSTAILNAMVRDGQARMVASTAQAIPGECTFYGIVVRNGLLNAVEKEMGGIDAMRLQQLRYYANPTAHSGFVLDAFLSAYELTLEDVSIIDLPGSAQVLNPLREELLDAAVLLEPWVTSTESAGVGEVWIDAADILPNIQVGVFVFGPNLLVDNQERGIRFLTAYLQGIQQLNAGKTERNLAILQNYLELDASTLDAVCLPFIPEDGRISVDSVANFVDWAAARNYIDRPIELEGYWAPSFIERATTSNR